MCGGGNTWKLNTNVTYTKTSSLKNNCWSTVPLLKSSDSTQTNDVNCIALCQTARHTTVRKIPIIPQIFHLKMYSKLKSPLTSVPTILGHPSWESIKVKGVATISHASSINSFLSLSGISHSCTHQWSNHPQMGCISHFTVLHYLSFVFCMSRFVTLCCMHSSHPLFAQVDLYSIWGHWADIFSIWQIKINT